MSARVRHMLPLGFAFTLLAGCAGTEPRTIQVRRVECCPTADCCKQTGACCRKDERTPCREGASCCQEGGACRHCLAERGGPRVMAISIQETPATQSAPAASGPSEEEKEKTAKEARDRKRKIGRMERELGMARQRLKKTQLTIEYAQLVYNESLARSEEELKIAREKLEIFRSQTVPGRIFWADMGMRGAEDSVKETREELQQLELMYKEDQFADQTKEIVLERNRRRLARAEESLEQQKKDNALLKEKTIPQETREQEMGVEAKQRELEKTKRDATITQIDNELTILSAQMEIEKMEQDLADARDEDQKADEKARKAAASQPSGS